MCECTAGSPWRYVCQKSCDKNLNEEKSSYSDSDTIKNDSFASSWKKKDFILRRKQNMYL